MSSFDDLYPVIGGMFDGDRWPHYEMDKYIFGGGDYVFTEGEWRWIHRNNEELKISGIMLGIGFSLALWVIVGIMMALILSDGAFAQGIGEHAIGVHSIGSATGGITNPNSGTLSLSSSDTGDIINLNNPGKSAIPDTPEARLRQAYEYCLTDFRGTQGIVMNGDRVATASFSDPNCAKIAQRWEGSQEQKHYNAELADWNHRRIAREKALIDQVASEGGGQQPTAPMRSRMKQ